MYMVGAFHNRSEFAFLDYLWLYKDILNKKARSGSMERHIKKICDRMIEKGIISNEEKDILLQNKSIQIIIIILARIGIL